jgi:hypothetical protein
MIRFLCRYPQEQLHSRTITLQIYSPHVIRLLVSYLYTRHTARYSKLYDIAQITGPSSGQQPSVNKTALRSTAHCKIEETFPRYLHTARPPLSCSFLKWATGMDAVRPLSIINSTPKSKSINEQSSTPPTMYTAFSQHVFIRGEVCFPKQ